MYFDRFPKGQYIIPGTKNYKLVTDLWRRIKIRDKIKQEASLYAEYFIKSGEKPEDIAQKHLGSPLLHWIILITNDIIDRYYDWPLTFQAFEEFVNDKYDNVDAIHHYEIPQSSGDTSKKINIGTSNSDYPTATAITNFEHEQEQQDNKRKIRLLDPSYLDDFVEEFKLLIRESTI